MKPYLHAKISAKKYGGVPADYQALHDFFDSSKAHVPDMRHRAALHTSFGIYLCERVFGATITNSEGKVVSVRDVGEDHVIQDCGTIPTLLDAVEHVKVDGPFGGNKPKREKITLSLEVD